jgi:hypothetical protein
VKTTSYCCWKCQGYLKLIYKDPVILLCHDCNDRYVIPKDILSDPKRVEEEIKIQFIMMEAFSSEGED